jgi:hypothetical protein
LALPVSWGGTPRWIWAGCTAKIAPIPNPARNIETDSQSRSWRSVRNNTIETMRVTLLMATNVSDVSRPISRCATRLATKLASEYGTSISPAIAAS